MLKPIVSECYNYFMISMRQLFSIKTLLKIICSIPVILIALYFMPPLGIILLIGHYFVYGNQGSRLYRAPISLLICGLVLLMPRGLELLSVNYNIDINLPLFTDATNLDVYPKIVEYAKSLLIIGVIFLLLSYVLKLLANKLSNQLGGSIKHFIDKEIESEEKVKQENDLKLKEKVIESKQKTPHVVKCPNCGKSNSIIGTVGKCKACRNHIEYKGKL